MRISAIIDRTTDQIIVDGQASRAADSAARASVGSGAASVTAAAAARREVRGGRQPSGRPSWALRREYRSTFRDTLTSGERLVAGKWFSRATLAGAGDTSEVSFEKEVAGELRIRLGDVVTWNVQGVDIPTRVTSFREVTWARFEPNFFAVFASPALRNAPKQFIMLSKVPDRTVVATLQRDVVRRFPNVASVDLSLIRETVAKIVAKVSTAMRFMALFSLAMGIPVLFSAVAATRRDRIREGVLLKTLGATRGQIMRILLAEYALLGLLGSLTGMLLAIGGGWALTRYVFEASFSPALVPAFMIAAAMLALTISIGLLAGRDVFKETPMTALREI